MGITSLATHEDGAVPVQLDDGSWRSVLSFPDLPLHSGDYVISAFLFDETGLAVYDEWFQFLHFSFIFPKRCLAWCACRTTGVSRNAVHQVRLPLNLSRGSPSSAQRLRQAQPEQVLKPLNTRGAAQAQLGRPDNSTIYDNHTQ